MLSASKMSVDEILKSLEEGIRQFMESDRYKSYLRAVGRFHNYSVNNITLITMQKPDATLVAGYTTWKNSFRRNVRKGEKGIRIIAPFPVKVEKEKDVTDSLGNVRKEKVTVTVPKFRAVSVFDVSQTEGEPLPNIDPGILTAEVEDYAGFIRALESVSPVQVRYEDIEGNARGYYDSGREIIAVQEGMSEAQTVKTLVHEIAHATLHRRGEEGAQRDPAAKEIEAESVAFTVCSSFGIDTSDYSFPYVSSWAGHTETGALRDSMERIRNTSSSLIDSIGKEYERVRQQPVYDLAAEIQRLERDYPEIFGEHEEDEETQRIADSLSGGRILSLMLFMGEAKLSQTDTREQERIQELMDRTRQYERKAPERGREDMLR